MALSIHAADLHLDSPLKGIEPYEGAPDIDEIRGATRQVLIKLLDLALEEQVRLLTFAVDLYGGDWQDFGTGLFFAQQMQRLATAGIQVAIVLVPAFIEQVRQQDPDAIAAALEKNALEKNDLHKNREELVAGIALAQNALKQCDGRSQAAILAVEANGLTGRLQTDVEQYIKLHMAYRPLR